MRDKMMETGSYTVKSEAYGASGYLPATIAELTPASSSRSLLLAGVRLYPLQYNAATRTLRKYTRIVVEVADGQRTTRPVVNKDEVPFASVLLNRNMASLWRLRLPQPRSNRAFCIQVHGTA